MHSSKPTCNEPACLCDSLLSAGVVDLTVVEDPAGHVVAHRAATDVYEPVGLHRAVAAASQEHAGLHLPRLRSRIVAFKKVEGGASCEHTRVQHGSPR